MYMAVRIVLARPLFGLTSLAGFQLRPNSFEKQGMLRRWGEIGLLHCVLSRQNPTFMYMYTGHNNILPLVQRHNIIVACVHVGVSEQAKLTSRSLIRQRERGYIGLDEVAPGFYAPAVADLSN